jgi:hypothetical protein
VHELSCGRIGWHGCLALNLHLTPSELSSGLLLMCLCVMVLT